MPLSSAEKAFWRRCISSAHPQQLPKCNPHLMPSLCNPTAREGRQKSSSDMNKDRWILCLLWQRNYQQRKQNCGSPCNRKEKAAPAVHSCPSHRAGGHWTRWGCVCSWEPPTNCPDHCKQERGELLQLQAQPAGLVLQNMSAAAAPPNTWFKRIHLMTDTALPQDILLLLSLDTAMKSTGCFLHASPSNYPQQITPAWTGLCASLTCCLADKHLKTCTGKSSTWAMQHKASAKPETDGLSCCRPSPGHLQPQVLRKRLQTTPGVNFRLPDFSIAVSSASLPCYWLIYSRLKNSKAYGICQPGQKEESSFTELMALYRLVKGASITPHAKHNVHTHLTFKVIFLFSALIYQGPPSPTHKRQAPRALVMLFMDYNPFQ